MFVQVIQGSVSDKAKNQNKTADNAVAIPAAEAKPWSP